VSASTTLYVVLDGALAGCPFEILFCPGKDAPLAMTHRVVRVPSAALLRYLRARETSAPEHSAVLAVASAIPALAGTRDEVAHLASRYGAHRSVDPDRAALLDAFSRFDVIHVASHVHVDRERPWNSGIQIRAQARPASPSRDDDPLALSARDSTEIAAGLPVDPFLRASEIAGRRVGARLVVLSACESALGRAAFAEGVPGLSSSFLSAGSRAVVASLWDVDDRATRDFMRHFYRGLETGQPVADALRRAQVAAREERPEPFYWAGFVVIGDGDVTVALEPRSRRAPVLGLALGGLVVAVSIPWVIWRRRTSRVRMAS
jgi:CHAT domain-containing protein